MATLTLTAKNKEQELILEYLEKSASDELADKINNGVPTEKDGLPLLNKKDLDGFMKYACEEAKKQAEKGVNYAIVRHEVVFGWAIHYFQEDEIIGKLYTLDGNEYNPAPKPIKKPNTPPTIPQIPKKEKKDEQVSLFNFEFENTPKTEEEPTKEERQVSPVYKRYLEAQNKFANYVIVLRVGDFYEVFGESAKAIANELDLTLTGRECGLDERVPMIGFPYHASDIYLKKITEKHKVVVVDSDTETVYENNLVVDSETGEVLATDLTLEEDDLITEQEKMKAFDKEALCVLLELFGDKLTIY